MKSSWILAVASIAAMGCARPPPPIMLPKAEGASAVSGTSVAWGAMPVAAPVVLDLQPRALGADADWILDRMEHPSRQLRQLFEQAEHLRAYGSGTSFRNPRLGLFLFEGVPEVFAATLQPRACGAGDRTCFATDEVEEGLVVRVDPTTYIVSVDAPTTEKVLAALRARVVAPIVRPADTALLRMHVASADAMFFSAKPGSVDLVQYPDTNGVLYECQYADAATVAGDERDFIWLTRFWRSRDLNASYAFDGARAYVRYRGKPTEIMNRLYDKR